MEYCALDIETATEDLGSICEIGVAFFDSKGDHLPVNDISYLVKPPDNIIDKKFTDIHGISPKDTADADGWEDVSPVVAEAVNSLPIVAHNAQFEIDHLGAYNLGASSVNVNNIFCSLRFSRYVDIGATGKHTLEAACARNGVMYHPEDAHAALYDSVACGSLWANLADKMGWTVRDSFTEMADLPSDVGEYEWFKSNSPPTKKQISYLLDLLARKQLDIYPEVNGVEAKTPVRCEEDLVGLTRSEISHFIDEVKNWRS